MSASTSTTKAIASSVAISICASAFVGGMTPRHGARTSGSVTPESAATSPFAEFALPKLHQEADEERGTSKKPKPT